eukprot:TRINITY_DN4783_c0_g1_i4.p1 TRINITY_DN4783_c0_g1~~TRINITY_DN4783_c0_g1_i4.p1  ORF type:complete len:391 (-),score=58.81 TRINITY_DN4783_c0_g1_i4:76-1248(-)
MGARASTKITPEQHSDVVPSAPSSTGQENEGLHNSSSFVPEMTFKKKPVVQRRSSAVELMLQSQGQERDPGLPGWHRECTSDTSNTSQLTDQLEQPRVHYNNFGLALASTRHLHHGSGSDTEDNLSPKTRQAQAGSPAPSSGSRRPSLSAMLSQRAQPCVNSNNSGLALASTRHLLLGSGSDTEDNLSPKTRQAQAGSPAPSSGSRQPSLSAMLGQLAQPRVNSNNSGLALASTRHLLLGSGSDTEDNLSPKTRQAQAESPSPSSCNRQPPLSEMLGVARASEEAGPKASPKNRRRPTTSSASSASAAGTTSLVAAANMKKQTAGRAESTGRLSFQDVSNISKMDKAALVKRRPSVQSDLGPVDFDKAARAKLKAVQDMWDLDDGHVSDD